MSAELTATLTALRERAVQAQAHCERLEEDLTMLKSQTTGKVLEVTQLSQLAKRMHHDHQSVRQMVLTLCEELEGLLAPPAPPAPPKGGKRAGG